MMDATGMLATTANTEEDDAIERINAVLKGPVTETLQAIVPELRAWTRREAYEQIMNSPQLAAHCFQEFRSKPECFEAFLVGPDDQPVGNDEDSLSCGRTLAQVIALVVRAVAKRHFRARLGFYRKTSDAPVKSPGLFQIIFGAYKPPPPPKAKKNYSRADALYQAMRAFLLFDWQVSLIPHYATLPLALVRDMGPRILQFREPGQIQALARGRRLPEGLLLPPATAVAPSAGTAAPTGKKPRSSVAPPRIDVLWSTCLRFGLPGLFGCDDQSMRRLVESVQGPGRPVFESLVGIGLIPPRAAVAAICLIYRMGVTRFEKMIESDRAAGFLQSLENEARKANLRDLEKAPDINRAIRSIVGDILPAAIKG
jgi:hypothetical protein